MIVKHKQKVKKTKGEKIMTLKKQQWKRTILKWKRDTRWWWFFNVIRQRVKGGHEAIGMLMNMQIIRCYMVRKMNLKLKTKMTLPFA
jgi:hypothetical protein